MLLGLRETNFAKSARMGAKVRQDRPNAPERLRRVLVALIMKGLAGRLAWRVLWDGMPTYPGQRAPACAKNVRPDSTFPQIQTRIHLTGTRTRL